MKPCDFCSSPRGTDVVRSPSGEEARACPRCVWDVFTKVDAMPADPTRGVRIELPPETRSRIVPSGQSAVFERLPIDHVKARRGG